MNNTQFKRIREALALQLNSGRYRKTDLLTAYNSMSTTEVLCKKPELADIISVIIVQQLENQYKALASTGLAEHQITKQLISRLDSKLQVLNLRGLSFSKKIQDIFNFESHSNSNYMTSNRQTRVNQQTIQNVWNSYKKDVQCLCPKAPSNLQQSKKMQKCYRCGQSYHTECFWPPQKQKGELFQCPFCYLKYCLPHKQVKQILFGGYLPILKKQKIEYKINFLLDSKTKADKTLYLQSRSIKFNNKNRYQISWPDNAWLSIGKIRIGQFKPLQTNSPLKRRPDEPIKLDKSRLQVENEIIIQERNICQNGYKLNKKCHHLIAIMVVQELSGEAVLSKFQKNLLPVKQSKKFLTENMSRQSNDVAIQKIAISLKCQYFGGKIKLPARSRQCLTHIQPFDLMNFINSSIHTKQSARRWKCPVCDRRAYDLFVDKYILDLMTQNPKANLIEFKQNGEPELIQHNEEENMIQCRDAEDSDDNININIDKYSHEDGKPVIIDVDDGDDDNENAEEEDVLPDHPVANINKNDNKQSLVIQSQEERQPPNNNQPTHTLNIPLNSSRMQKSKKSVIGQQIKSPSRSIPAGLATTQGPTNNTSNNSNGTNVNTPRPSPFGQNYGTLKKIRQLNNGQSQIFHKENQRERRTNNYHEMNLRETNRNRLANIQIVDLESDEDYQPTNLDAASNLQNRNNNSNNFVNSSHPKGMERNSVVPNEITTTTRKLGHSGSQRLNNSDLTDKYQNKQKIIQKPNKGAKHTPTHSQQQSLLHKLPIAAKNKAKAPEVIQPDPKKIISIDSDNEPEQRTQQQIQKQLMEEMDKIRRNIERQGKVEITQQDTELFQAAYNRLLSIDNPGISRHS